MNRGWILTGFVGAAIAASLVAWQTTAREQAYRNLLGRGESALAARDTVAAVEAYSGAIALHPESMLPYLRRGETYQLRGDLEGAARDFRKASDLDPSATRPLEALGDVLYERGRYPQAAAAFARRLELDDAAPVVAFRLALTRYRLSDFAGALSELDRVAASGNDTAELSYLRGLCLRDSGDFEGAVSAFEAAVERSPGMIAAREELAEIYSQLRRHGEALEHLQVIAGLDRQSVDRQIAVGLALARAAAAARNPATARRNEDLAILTLTGALERAPDQARLYGALGRVWLEIAIARDDRIALQKAIEALGRIASDPDTGSDVLTAYGRALTLEQQLPAAARVLELAMARFPVDPEAFDAYARVAEAHGDAEGARQALVRYDALTPGDQASGRRARRIAALSLRVNDPRTAITWLERALQESPGDRALLQSLIEAHIAVGNSAAARQTLERGLARYPGDESLQGLGVRTGLTN